MANSPVVSGLPSYVEEHRLPLLSASILGAKTARLLTLQSGIKSSAALNILSTDVTFGDGSTCGWNEAGTQTLSQRTLVTGQVKINMAYCDKALLGKWAEYQVRIGAGQKTLPFEEDFMNELVKHVQDALDTAIWQGDTSSATVNLKRFDGLVKIINAASGTVKETVASGSTYFAAVQTALLKIPAAAIKDDTVIFCNPDFFRNYVQELVTLNLYHYNPGDSIDEIVIPGSSVRLISVGGLGTVKKLVGGRLSNMFFGTDLMDNVEKFDLWYSQDNREFRVAIEFNAGVQVAFPGEISLITYTTLTSPALANTSLANIASTNATIATNTTPANNG